MKQRSTEIVQYIIKHYGKEISVDKFILRYEISVRTLRNDIKEINSFFRTIPLDSIEIKENGTIKVPDSFDPVLAEKRLYEMDKYTYKFSPEERQNYILLELIQNSSYTTMHHFADSLFVSRVTIMSDFEAIKDLLNHFSAKLVLDIGKGIKLGCPYETKLEIIIFVYREMAINIDNSGYYQRTILEKMNVKYTFSEIVTYTQEYLSVNNIVFLEDTFYNIALYLFTIFNFPPGSLGQTDNEISSKTKLSSIGHVMLYVGYMLESNVTEKMVDSFQAYIKKNKLYSYVKTVDEIELYKVIRYFVSGIDKKMQLGIKNDSILDDSLLTHIKSMKDWGNYEVELPSSQDSAVNYEELMQAVEENAPILEKFLSYKLSDNMRKSIVIHICVAVIRNQKYLPKLSVAISCPGSMATGKYLEAQIKNYFDFHIVGVFSANEIIHELKRNSLNVDFIISTIQIRTTEYPVLKVNAFLTMKDLNKIQREILKSHDTVAPIVMREQKHILEELQSLLENEQVSSSVYDKVNEIIHEYHCELSEKPNPITELLRPEYITIDNQVSDWREAMRKSAQVLEKEGFIESRYIEKAIEHVEEYGDYIVVSNGVALAHAEKECGVFKDGLSLLVSKPGVLFSEPDHVVHLLFCFASSGKREYLELLKSIVSIGKKTDKMQIIQKLDSVEAIYKEITHE